MNPEKTVDQIIFGNGDKKIKKVAVCWYPAIRTIQSAIDADCDLLITHELTWWDHFNSAGEWQRRGIGLNGMKQKKST